MNKPFKSYLKEALNNNYTLNKEESEIINMIMKSLGVTKEEAIRLINNAINITTPLASTDEIIDTIKKEHEAREKKEYVYSPTHIHHPVLTADMIKPDGNTVTISSIGKGVKRELTACTTSANIILKDAGDGRNNVSNRTLENLAETMYEQDDYGMDKYKEPLHYSYNYDWMKMFQQEIADGLKYLQMEMDRKEEVKQILISAKHCYSMSEKDKLIDNALSLLNAGGRENKGK